MKIRFFIYVYYLSAENSLERRRQLAKYMGKVNYIGSNKTKVLQVYSRGSTSRKKKSALIPLALREILIERKKWKNLLKFIGDVITMTLLK